MPRNAVAHNNQVCLTRHLWISLCVETIPLLSPTQRSLSSQVAALSLRSSFGGMRGRLWWCYLIETNKPTTQFSNWLVALPKIETTLITQNWIDLLLRVGIYKLPLCSSNLLKFSTILTILFLFIKLQPFWKGTEGQHSKSVGRVWAFEIPKPVNYLQDFIDFIDFKNSIAILKT
jgi:hypothetical protein